MDNQIIYFGKVVDAEDELMLGRVRVEPLNINLENFLNRAPKECIDPNSNDVVSERILKACRWKKNDPFVFLSLLPYELNITPATDELVSIFYSSNERKFPNQFYVKGPISTPLALESEYYEASKNLLADGTRDKYRRPLKSVFQGKQKRKGKIIRPESEGIFPEPEDNALLSRGRTDLILKKNEVLLRAGKYSNPTLSPNETPIANSQRSFVQLSFFETKKTLGPTYVSTNFELKVDVVKKLIEWTITNPENAFDKFNGYIRMYSVKPNEKTNTKNLGEDPSINVNQFITSLPDYEIRFEKKGFDEIVEVVNSYIQGVNDGEINVGFSPEIPLTINLDKNDTFPFVFRPDILTLGWLNKQRTFPTQFSRIDAFKNAISFKGKKGWGLVSAQDKVGQNFTPKIEETIPVQIINTPQSIASMGGNQIYLITHGTSIPGTKPINLDKTLYGIDQNKFLYEIEPATNSVLRAETFTSIIRMIVSWMGAHYHPLPHIPPRPQSANGIELSEIEKLLADESAYMNKNIRIN